ncbi:MAG: hypothetical protein ACJAWS_001794 [Oleiphilaceae bacterium]|jgi:hypothetical protein
MGFVSQSEKRFIFVITTKNILEGLNVRKY